MGVKANVSRNRGRDVVELDDASRALEVQQAIVAAGFQARLH
jgi:hypothetical protein